MERRKVSLYDLVMSISQATDVVSMAVADHQKRVGYIAHRLAEQIGLPLEQQNQLLIAGALHDIGALSLSERLSALSFEAEKTESHARIGSCLLASFEPFHETAQLVRFHHRWWHEFEPGMPKAANLLHLADRIDVLIDHRRPILTQAEGIRQRIRAQSGSMFDPELVRAFLDLSRQEAFWLDLSPAMLLRALTVRGKKCGTWLGTSELSSFARMFSQIIDFRSRYTATHSSGVAACAAALAKLSGMKQVDVDLMRIAGYLHDIGKLAIPNEILEKPSGLTKEEYSIIRSHTFYTYRILETVEGLEQLAGWAAFHHERLDGTGYPFRLCADRLCLGSRIMGVADVFAAITEDRPYRRGLGRSTATALLQKMALEQALDSDLVALSHDHYDRLSDVRSEAQTEATMIYDQFWHDSKLRNQTASKIISS